MHFSQAFMKEQKIFQENYTFVENGSIFHKLLKKNFFVSISAIPNF